MTWRQVLDVYTRDVLPADLVAKAHEEEVAMMESRKVWDGITMGEAGGVRGSGR